MKQFKELAGTVAIVTGLGLAAAVFTGGTSYLAVRFGIKGLLLAFMRKASKYINKLPADSIIRKLFNRVFNSLLKSRWHKSTFNCVEDSWKHHLRKHGKGRSIDEYTKAAEEFWEKYKHLGVKQTLKDGT